MLQRLLLIPKLEEIFNDNNKAFNNFGIHNILNFSPDGIICLDKNLKVIFYNEKYKKWTGKHAKDFIRFLNQENFYCFNHFVGSNKGDFTIKVQINSKILSANFSKTYNAVKQITGYVVTLRDITREEIAQKQKEDFIAMISHDLKTPIRAQVRALELLLSKKFDEQQQKEMLESILASTNFVSTMNENILTKFKIERGNLSIIKCESSIKALVEDCAEKLKYVLLEKQQKLKIIYKTKEEILNFDAVEIKRVLNNLIMNASEHSPVGSEILVTVEKGVSGFLIKVKDFGSGIDKNHIKKIFNDYITFSNKYKKVGTGLGLSISKKIVEAHGGKIQVASRAGFGSVFKFNIPQVSNSIKENPLSN